MIAGFRKPKRNFRKKVTTEDEEDHSVLPTKSNVLPFLETPHEIETEPQVPIKQTIKKTGSKEKLKNTKSSSKGTGLLSFEHELDEGEEFQLKKTKESRKLMQQLKDDKKKKKQTDTNDVVGNEAPSQLPLEAKEINTNDIREELDNDVELPEEEDSDEEQQADFSTVHTDLSTGVIPDAATIFALKKQRERARQNGPGADFVPLQSTAKYQGRFNASTSRLVREDDDSDEERIEFKGSQQKSFPALERRKEVSFSHFLFAF